MTDHVEPPRPPGPGQEIPTGHLRGEDYRPENLFGGSIDDWHSALWPVDEADRSYLASLLSREDANEVMWRSAVEPRFLQNPEYATILEGMIAVRDRGEKVDLLAVALEVPAFEDTVWHITDHWANPAYVEHFADQILRRYRRQNVKDVGGALSTIASESAEPNLSADVEGAVAALAAGPGVRDVVMPDLHEIAFSTEEAETYLPTPWASLDAAIVGFLPGSLYTLSGDTGSGKSAIALQLATSLAEVGTCLYFTMEMRAKEQGQRLLAQQTQVPLANIRKRDYPYDWMRNRIADFTRNRRIPIAFDDRGNMPVSEIRRTALGTTGLSGIVVDQLSLMDYGAMKGENLSDAIARTTSALKALAMDLNVPVIMLSQLNREAARSGRPTRHHLYGSSAIANDADVILILHRENRQQPQQLTLMIEKNRQGEEGDVELTWHGEFVRADE